jgi:hypothetical protein
MGVVSHSFLDGLRELMGEFPVFFDFFFSKTNRSRTISKRKSRFLKSLV